MSLAGIWTGKGIDKLAAQTAGGPAINITRIVLGDGGGVVPAVLPSQTALFRELWRGNVNTVLIDADTPNAVVVESVIPYNVGGFFIREWGLLDADGDLIAVGPHAEFYKPKLEEGSGAELLERIKLPIANAGQVSLTVSSDALATRDFVLKTATDIAALGDTAVSEAAEAALALVRALASNHHARHATGGADPLAPADIGAADSSVAIMAGQGLTGGGDLSANRTLAVKYGTAAGTACQGNDSRLNDTRAPKAHKNTHKTGGADPLAPADIGAAANTITITAGTGLSGGGNLTANRTLAVKLVNAVNSTDATSAATANAVKIAYDKAVAAYNRTPYELCEFYFFRHPSLRPSFQPAQGGLLQNAATLYPEAWAYLQTVEGRKLCKTEAEWQAMTTATWATLADGSKVGWNGIGGAPYYAPNTATGALRLPDLRGMYVEAAGFDALGVGGTHGDAGREILGTFPAVYGGGANPAPAEGISGCFASTLVGVEGSGPVSASSVNLIYAFAASRMTPVANKVQPRAWGALACCYLGAPR